MKLRKLIKEIKNESIMHITNMKIKEENYSLNCNN